MRKDWTKLFLIVGILLMMTYAYAQDQTDSEYIWESPLGKLRLSDRNPDILIFDTYEPLTTNKETIVQWNDMNPEKVKAKLTDKAFEIHQRLFKHNDVLGISISYRAILIQRFPLVDKDRFIIAVEEILK